MSISFGVNGLTLDTQSDLVTFYTTQFESIYGSDINLGSETPDGQMMMIWVQAILDLEELLMQIYTSIDPDQAVGTVLDQRVSVNNIQRQVGTYSTINLTVVTSKVVNLYGLNQNTYPVFTYADNAGTQWQLVTTVLSAPIGTYVYLFQAAIPGAVLSLANTINIPITIIIGVTSVNNPSANASTGINEETDVALKLRRSKSTSINSQGYNSSLYSTLLNLTGITDARVYENSTASTDVNGVPSHTTWVFVKGVGYSASAIANAIYQKRNAGCGMYGSVSYSITQIDGSIFVVKWDYIVAQNPFITFTTASLNGIANPNLAALSAGIPTTILPGIYTALNVNEIVGAIQAIDSNTLATSVGVSDGTSQTLTLSDVAASGSFYISYNGHTSAIIHWNDSISTIQSTVQAVTGLSACTVTGSIASKSLVFTLVLPVALIAATTNTLENAGTTPITFTYNINPQNNLLPTSILNQFVLTASNIYMLPMQLSPSTISMVASAQKTFSGLGGYGTLVYSILINNSGGSINSSSGLYTAGTSYGVVDTLKVVDLFGNYATALVTITGS